MADKKISALTASTTPLAGTEVLPIVQGGSTVKVSVANLTAGRSISASSIGIGTLTPDAAVTAFKPDAVDVRSSGVNVHRPTAYGQYGSFAFDNDVTYISSTYTGGGTGVYGRFIFQAYDNTSTPASRITIDSVGNVTVNAGNLVMGTAGKGIDFSANTGTAGMTSQLLDDYEEGTWTPNQGPGLTVVGAFSSSGTYTKIGRCVTVRGQLVGATSVACNSSGLLVTNLPFTVSGASAGAAGNGNVNQGSTVIAFNVQVYLMTTITASASIDFTVTYFV